MRHKITQIISLLSFLIMLFAAIKGLTYLLVPMSRADFFIHDMERMKKQGQNIDMIIIGNSHYLFGFNPVIFEEKLGLDNAYNASISGMEMTSKYYITEAMIEDFEPSIIMFDLDWWGLMDANSPRTQSKLLGLDRLTGIRKLRYILSDFEPSELIYAVSKLYRFGDRLFWEDYIPGNVRQKRWAEQTDYKIDYYQTIKGFDQGSACSSKPFPMSSKGTFDASLISEHRKAYLDKIVDLCKSKNIELFLVTSPFSAMLQMNLVNYQGAVDYFSAYAREKGVHFFDLNMLKGRDGIFPDELFYDPNHLCEPGAARASEISAELIRDELAGIDISDRFYSSMDELAADISRVVAAGAEVEVGKGAVQVNNLKFTAGNDAEVLFEVQVSEDGKNFVSQYTELVPGVSIEIPAEKYEGKKLFIRVIGRDIQNGTEAYADYQVNIS